MVKRLLAALGASSALGAGAQSLDHAALEQLFGEPVTTSVTGSPQRASDVPASMEIITADQIRRSGARDIPGILRHVAGVDVLQTTNDHGDASVRGYNQPFSPRLLVLVDGRQVYADYYGFTPWSTIPIELEAIRQIEIVRGPNTALFGFNAVAGVVNIITYDALDDVPSSASITAGTQDLTQASAVSGWRLGDRAGIRLSAGVRRNDDFATPERPFEIGTRRGNEREALNVAATVVLTDSVHLELEGTHSEAAQTQFTPPGANEYGVLKAQSLKAHVAAETAIGLVEATAYTNEISADSFRGADERPFLSFDNRVTVARVQAVSKIGSDHTLRLSAEYRDNTLPTTSVTGGEVFYNVAAIGGMWELRVKPRLTLTNAVRVDSLSLGRKGTTPPGYGLSNADWDRSRTDSSFNSGVLWRVRDGDTLRFQVARGVQLPGLLSLGSLLIASPVGYASGVPDLASSVYTGYEVAWDRALSAGAELRVNVFQGHTSDVIAIAGGFDPAAGLISTPTNIGRSYVRGIEVAVDGAVGEAWQWGVSYTPIDVEDRFAPGFTVATTAADFEHTVPRHVLNARLGWARGRLEVDAYLRYQSDFEGVINAGYGVIAPSAAPISSYTSVDARVGYALNERVLVAIAAQNLTRSEQRQTAAPDVERRILGTVSFRF